MYVFERLLLCKKYKLQELNTKWVISLRIKQIVNIVLLLLGFSSFAQEGIHYTVKDGLPSNHVYIATQDVDGFMWFGTDEEKEFLLLGKFVKHRLMVLKALNTNHLPIWMKLKLQPPKTTKTINGKTQLSSFYHNLKKKNMEHPF